MANYWESLTGDIYIEGSAELMAELGEARAVSKKAAGAGDALKSRLSPVAESVAAIAPIASICNHSKSCAVAVSDFQGYEAPARAEREEIKIPFYDLQARIECHRDHVRAEAIKTARLSEIARLKARDDYEASKLPAPQASPEPVQAAPAKRVLTSAIQDAAILAAIRKAGHDPLALPRNSPGKPGIKAAIRNSLVGVAGTPFPKEGRRFDKSWDRLRERREIAEA